MKSIKRTIAELRRSGFHPNAKHGKRIEVRHALKTGKRGTPHLFDARGLTNHERVIRGRAERMGISVAEYRRRFCA